jgi:hypothetical protein
MPADSVETVVIYLLVILVCAFGYPVALNIIRARRRGNTFVKGLAGSAWGFVVLAPLCVLAAVWQIVLALTRL